MKQVTILFAILSASLIWTSCSKSGNDVTPPPAGRQLKTLTSVFDGGTPAVENYTYDSQGRLTSAVNSSRSYSFSYSGSSSMLITVYQLPANTLHSTIEGSFNPGGTLSKLVYRNPAGQVTYTYEFTYDAAGYMIKSKGITAAETSEEVFTIQNGDVVTASLYSNGVLTSTVQHTYDLTRPHKLPTAYWYIWPSETWFGKKNTHAMTEFKRTDAGGAVSWHYTDQHEYDSELFPVRTTRQYLHNGKSALREYLYY